MSTTPPAPGIPPDALLEHAGFVRSVARGILGQDVDVDDASQAALTTALERGPATPEARRPWLAAVVRNAALTLVRGRSRRDALAKRAALRRAGEGAVPAAGPSTVDAAVRAETVRRVGEAVAALEEPERTAILLRHYDGLPPREIAARLAVPVATVKSRLHRAHARLRERLEEGGTREAARRRRALAAFAGLVPVALETTAVGGGLTAAGAWAAALLVAAGVGAVAIGASAGFGGGRGSPPPPVGENAAPSVPDARRASASAGLARAATSGASSRAVSTIVGTVRRDGLPAVARIEVSAPRERRLDGDDLEGLTEWMRGPVPPPEPVAVGASGADGSFAIEVPGSGWGTEVRATAADGAIGSVLIDLPAVGARVRTSIDLAPYRAVLEGRALHRDGRPFVGRVTAAPAPVTGRYLRPPFADVGADGRFTLTGLPAGTVTVFAFRPGEVVARRDQVAVPSPEPFTFVVDAGLAPLAGRVLDAQDVPVVGATVVTGGARGSRATRTGPDGRFTIDWGGGMDRLVVVAPGFSKVDLFARDLFEPFEVRLLRAGALAGRVVRTDDGGAVPGARVQVFSLRSGGNFVAAETTASDDGTFELARVPSGPLAVVGSGPGLRSPVVRRAGRVDGRVEWDAVTTEVAPGARGAVDVRLVPAARIGGRLLDSDGTPLAGAVVRVTDIDRLPANQVDLDLSSRAWATDARGEFVVDGLQGGLSYSFTATHPDRAPATAAALPRDGETTALELRFPPVRTIVVTAVDEGSQAPRRGLVAEARAVQGTDFRWAGVTDAAGKAVLRGPAEGGLFLEVKGPGTFATRALEAGVVEVTVVLTERERRRPTLPPPPGDERSPASTSVFVAHVSDPAGKPIPRARAELRSPRGASGVSVGGGRATFDRAPDDATTLDVWAPTDLYENPLPLAGARVSVPMGATEIDVRLGPERALEGVAVGPDGRGVSGVAVFASWTDHLRDLRTNPHRTSALGAATSDARGRFRVGGLPDVDVALVAVPPMGSAPVPSRITRAGSHDVRIVVRPGVTAHLTVVDGAGVPVPDASVQLARSNDAGLYPDPGTRTTDAAGTCRFDDLDPAATYLVSLRAEGTPRTRKAVVEDWAPKDDRFRLADPVTVHGVVVDPAGGPVPDAVIQSALAKGEGDEWSAWSHSRADGSFQIEEVVAGSVRLRASLRDSLARSEATIRVGSDSTNEIRLVLDPGETRVARLVGVPAGAWANLYEGDPGPDAPRCSVHVDAEGRATFAGMRGDRRYTLWSWPQGADTYVLVRDLAWGAEERTFEAVPGRTVTGTTSHVPAGEAELQVFARGDGLTVTGTIDGEGRFAIRGLPPGEWTVRVQALYKGWMYRGDAPVPADGRVEVTLAPEER